MIEILRWVTLVILWVCIGVNGVLIFRNYKLGKQWEKTIEEVKELAIEATLLRDRYLEWFGTSEEVFDERDIND